MTVRRQVGATWFQIFIHILLLCTSAVVVQGNSCDTSATVDGWQDYMNDGTPASNYPNFGTGVCEYNLQAMSGLTGTIPTELGLMTSLAMYRTARTSLSGTLPTQLGRLTGLTVVTMATNTLSGAIPTQIGKWTAIGDGKSVNLKENSLQSTIPTQLGNMIDHWCGSSGSSSCAAYLYLQSNELVGSIPAELLYDPDVDTYLYDNKLCDPNNYCNYNRIICDADSTSGGGTYTNADCLLPTAQPTLIPKPTLTPSMSPKPTLGPSPKPTLGPSPKPTLGPSSEPTITPASVHPSPVPTSGEIPSASPTSLSVPSHSPIRTPTAVPSVAPTPMNSVTPTLSQTHSHAPSVAPSFASVYSSSSADDDDGVERLLLILLPTGFASIAGILAIVFRRKIMGKPSNASNKFTNRPSLRVVAVRP